VTAAACGALVLGGCTIKEQSAPDLIGPSGFGVSLAITANPTILPRDGSSQATVTVVARDSSGKPQPNVSFQVNTSPGIPVVQLDQVTGTDGSARFRVTAPSLDMVAPYDNNLVLWLTPLGDAIAGDFQNAREQSVRVNLSGPRNATYPSPDFTIFPEVAKPFGSVVLDATKTTDEGVPCVTCTYLWNVEGIQLTGPVVAVAIGLPGSYSVILTVIDVTGTKAQAGKVIEVEEEETPAPTTAATPLTRRRY
jgi:hypothetical protein